ncbi:MAG: hypothetical protein KGJ56_00890 [Gammaproteobacteria bacterium]|nr:hypothetical protein [Gammaproteobacteria bacterium]
MAAGSLAGWRRWNPQPLTIKTINKHAANPALENEGAVVPGCMSCLSSHKVGVSISGCMEISVPRAMADSRDKKAAYPAARGLSTSETAHPPREKKSITALEKGGEGDLFFIQES